MQPCRIIYRTCRHSSLSLCPSPNSARCVRWLHVHPSRPNSRPAVEEGPDDTSSSADPFGTLLASADTQEGSVAKQNLVAASVDGLLKAKEARQSLGKSPVLPKSPSSRKHQTREAKRGVHDERPAGQATSAPQRPPGERPLQRGAFRRLPVTAAARVRMADASRRARISHRDACRTVGWIRPKYIHIQPVRRRFARQEFSTFWNINMACLLQRYDKQLTSHPSVKDGPPRLLREAAAWATEAMQEMRGILGAPETSQPLAVDGERWKNIAVWLLYYFPRQMVNFLHATHEASPPTFCVEDSLKYLVAHFAHSGDSDATEQMQLLRRLFAVLAARKDGARLAMDGTCIRQLMQHCNEEQTNELYRTIEVHRVKVPWQSLLHFATHFLKHGQFDKGLDALLAAKGAGASLIHRAFLRTCAAFLRGAIRMPGGFRVCLRLIDNLVQIGVKLNIRLCNIIMLNAVEAGDMKTALAVYNSLLQHGLEADHYTYAILLKGCKACIDDAQTLNHIIRDAISHSEVLKHKILATEILHCLALHHSTAHPETAYETVANAYAHLFDTTSVQNLGLRLPTTSSLGEPVQKRLVPDEQPVAILLRMFLHHSHVVRLPTPSVYDLYTHYRSLVESGDQPFLSLAATDHVANAFLLAFTKIRAGLTYAAEVIKDMQRPLAPELGVVRCPPTQQTWSIFLHGFTTKGEMRLAEQVMRYMQSKGIEPNVVTWNTLAGGHAAAQDAEALLDTLRKMEASGHGWTAFTHKSVNRFKDAETFRRQWQDDGPTLDFTADLRSGLEKRLSSAEGTAAVDPEVKVSTPSSESANNTTYSPLS